MVTKSAGFIYIPSSFSDSEYHRLADELELVATQLRNGLMGMKPGVHALKIQADEEGWDPDVSGIAEPGNS